MSVLTVVRHGQASMFADEYDKLSPLGEEQSRLLGRHWAKQRQTIDEVYAGPRSRQRMSAELAGQEYQQAGLPWPEVTILDDLDEFDLDGLLSFFVPRLLERNPEFALLVQNHRTSDGEQDRLRNFQRMFESLLRHWQAAESLDGDIESWPEFCRRAQRVIRRFQEHSGRGRRVVCFTSGGMISGIAQAALGVSDQKALELIWRIRNGSLTEFVFTHDRFSLDGFNLIPHLDDPKLWTYV